MGTAAGLCLGSFAGAIEAQTPGAAPQGGLIDWSATERAPQIVIGHPGTPTTARDPDNVTGVGQMIVSGGGGSIGVCTGTLINPRMVLFAAHCVNSRAANAYGAGSGGVPIGFGFSNDNLPGVRGWFLAGPGQHQTNTAAHFYNANHVAYHPASLEPDARSFLYGDVAIASLDTAAGDIPTWALLFSALPAPTITANGTGYHVNIAGYGRNGTGATGSTGGIDFRRRVAENMLGALASIDSFEQFLFVRPPGVLTQNLYWIDFDDPRRGTAQADPRDFNVWRDNPQPNEGTTAPGDSGGPLILDRHFSMPVVLGVLSGGYTRFFSGAPANGYGTTSFYQPLYLYWDWIAANNPYRYVSARAGDRDWTDASHWVTNLDPNYQIIGPNGQLVNGVPTDLGEGQNGTDGAFGQACFESGGFSQCLDMATGEFTAVARPIGTEGSSNPAGAPIDAGSFDDGGLANNAAVVQIGAGARDEGDPGDYGLADGVAERVSLDGTAVAGEVGTAALPAATLANGLPGASNFVPNNTDGDRLANIAPRYFDVTLSANGTTTLGSAVTIDRLTLAGMGAGLNITASGSLLSNIDITQLTGTLNVDGELRTPGDFFMMSGGLSGRGTITTPFFTNMAGTIAPGTPSTIGTLNFDGNVILASGSTLLINLGASGVSDLIAVSGEANLGGRVVFGYVQGTTPRDGDSFTFLTAQGGLSGAFMAPAPISAILTPALTYGANSVQVQIEAGLYADVVTNSPIQAAYARLLDQNRGQYSQFADLYGPLDLLSATGIQANLEALAPRAETLKTAMGTTAVDSMGRFYRGRLSSATRGNFDGSFEVIGRPIEYASAAMDSLDGGSVSPMGDAEAAVVVPNALPDNMRGYIAAGYVDGRGAPMSTATGGGKDDFDGYFISAGIETALDNQRMIGFAVSGSDLSGSTAALPQSAEGELWQGAVYGRYQSAGGLAWSGQLSYGRFDVETRRIVALGPNLFTLRTEDEAAVWSAEVGVGYSMDRQTVVITPDASLRASHVDYGETTETGGGPALRYNRDDATSLEGRVGVSVAGVSPTFRPWFSAHVVHALKDQPAAFGANFVGGTGPDVLFALASEDDLWGEVELGVDVIRDDWRLTVAAATTVEREDVETQTYRAAISFRF